MQQCNSFVTFMQNDKFTESHVQTLLHLKRYIFRQQILMILFFFCIFISFCAIDTRVPYEALITDAIKSIGQVTANLRAPVYPGAHEASIDFQHSGSINVRLKMRVRKEQFVIRL